MKVIKRSGELEEVNYDKITQKIKRLSNREPVLTNVDGNEVSKRVIMGFYDEMTTVEIDELAAETAATMCIKHPEYSQLAARIVVDNLHKTTPDTFMEAADDLLHHINGDLGKASQLISKDLHDKAFQFRDKIDDLLNDCEADYNYDYFGIKTLMRSYLLKSYDEKIIERPQYMLMRVALSLYDSWNFIRQTYELLRDGYYTHATPTLFNAGTPIPQLSSCFLLANESDSVDGFFNTIHDAANISKWAGGLGISIHNARANGSYIRGTGGKSSGIVPMCRTYNDVARWIDQGGKRKGSFAMYLEPWHSDVFSFLDLKKNHGKEEMRARDLFYALWIPDLFMERVDQDEFWTLMCPFECPGLDEVYGDSFKELYESYEREGRGKKTIKARELWNKILESQIETGTPYMLYKDAANEKSNQKNLGTIKSSNLCTEIIEYSDENETAVCNLASIAVNKFVRDDKIDYEKLHEVAYHVTVSLNRVIDLNFYPTEKTRRSNLRHRPIGIGIQGLADLFFELKLPFDSEEAREINDYLFETIYHAALEASMTLADEEGAYETFQGSPASQGILQYDLWDKSDEVELSKRYDWSDLKSNIKKVGLRNSLLLAPMPTASTAQILGNNECFEPITSNLYTRRVLSGEFIVINKHLVKDLIELDLWNDEMINELKVNNGSVQQIDSIPDDLKKVYKTAFEISQKSIIDMAADRGKFIDQSQSMNIFMEKATFGKLTSMHFHGWRSGLKTGMYYLRTKAATDAIKFTANKSKSQPSPQEEISCSIDNQDDCVMCGS